MKIAILTCEKCPALAPRDLHLLPLFAMRNVHVDITTWNDPEVNWLGYDGLLFRSVWDYHLKFKEFNIWLNDIARQNIKTLNPIEVIRQNQHKFYLQHLESCGIGIIPTIFIPKTEGLDISGIENRGWQRAVIKPAVSASSYLTTLFAVKDWRMIETNYSQLATERDLLLQSYMPEVTEDGEMSLIFFNRRFSHAVLKRPIAGEFRVQAEYGGVHEPFSPSKEVIETAENILSLIPGALLYARVDGLIKNDRFLLMELELLEPDLYFDALPEASERYVDAVIELLKD